MADLSDLTPRDLEVLQLVLAGRTNRAIAAEIHICEKTVEFHLNNVYSKVGVRTRSLVRERLKTCQNRRGWANLSDDQITTNLPNRPE
jgi:DNA-binding NarL/FixJ family response regulator